MSCDERICEYFLITGLTPARKPYDLSQIYSHTEEISKSNLVDDIFKFKEPIVEVQLINAKEKIPQGFILVDRTYNRQYKADLYGKSSVDELYLCYRCGRDLPPITDLWLFNPKEKLSHDSNWVYIDKTITGQHSANLHSSTSNPLYLVYRRAAANAPVDCMAITDICIILTNKNEQCPPAYTRVNVNLKRSTLSHTINICYKKSIVKEHVLTYRPETLYCLSCTSTEPIVDVCNPNEGKVKPSTCLPSEIIDVANFCMPWGATIETWSTNRMKPKPSFLSFVLTDEKYNRMYGAAMLFYDELNRNELSSSEIEALKLPSNTADNQSKQLVFASKALCLLSHNSLLATFKHVLEFIIHLDQRQRKLSVPSKSCPFELPLERFISQLLHTIPMPTPQTPNILLQWDLERPIAIHLPQSSYSANNQNLYHLIRLLDVDHIIQLFIYMLTEQKLLITSVSNSHLTDIAEALIATIFPFCWSVVYIPFLYLSCIHVIQSPAPYLIGAHSRFFDYFHLPEGVGCVDLITKSIKAPDCNSKNLDFNKVLPKNVLKSLKYGLSNCKSKVGTFEKEQNLRKSTGKTIDELTVLRKRETIGESIRECFLRALILMFKNYERCLVPLDRRTTSDDMFRVDHFLKSVDRNSRPLYQAIFDTQLWNNFILSRSQSIEFDESLVFFDRCIRQLSDLDEERANITPLFQTDSVIKSEHTKVFEPPEPIEGWKADSEREGFPNSLISSYMLTPIHSNIDTYNEISSDYNNLITSQKKLKTTPQSNSIDNQIGLAHSLNLTSSNYDTEKGSNSNFMISESSLPSILIRADDYQYQPQFQQTTINRLGRRGGMSSILKRPIEELKQARQLAKEAKVTSIQSSNLPMSAAWATHLLASSYCLWFLCLPGLVGQVLDSTGLKDTYLVDRILQLAVETLGTMQNQLPDEVSYRITMLLIRQLKPRHTTISDLKSRVNLNAFSYGLCNQIMLEEQQELAKEKPVQQAGNDHYDGIAMRQIDSQSNFVEKKETKDLLINEKDCDSGHETLASTNIASDEGGIANQNKPDTPKAFETSSDLTNENKIDNATESVGNKRNTIEIGGKIIKLRGKSQAMIGGGGNKGRHRYSQLMVHPQSHVRHLSQQQPPLLNINDVLLNRTENCDDNIQYFNKSAGIIMTTTLKSEKSPLHKLAPISSSDVDESNKESYPSSPPPPSSLANLPLQNLSETNDTNPINRERVSATNPIHPAIISNRTPFSEERSEIHQSFLKGRSSKSNNSDLLSKSNSSSSQVVTEAIDSLKECKTNELNINSTQTYGSLISAASSDCGSDAANTTQSELGQSDFFAGNKARVSLRQIKNVANKSLRSFKNAMNSVSTTSWLSPSNDSESSTSNRMNDSASGGGTGIPATFRPWNQSKQNSNGNKNLANRFTASADVLNKIDDDTGASSVDSSFAVRPGLATVQQIRRNPSPLQSQPHYMNTLSNAAHQWSGGGDSCDSIHSDRSLSTASLDMESQSFILDNAWEHITGSLAAIKLPPGKYWIKSSQPSEESGDYQDDNSSESKGNASNSVDQDTVECQNSIFVNMTSCTQCPNCKHPIYDDSIMQSWSCDDSDHRAVCNCCGASTTPQLHYQVYIRVPETTKNDNEIKNYRNVLAFHKNESYLSPFVVRKELESVIDQEGEMCLLRPDFYYRHRYLYWNLIWYFNRLQLPTHLLKFLTLWLKSQGEQMANNDKDRTNETKKNYQVLLDLTGYEQVSIVTYWEFYQLSSRSGGYLFRNYISYLQAAKNPSGVVSSLVIQYKNICDKIYQYLSNNELPNAIEMIVKTRKYRIDEENRQQYIRQQEQQSPPLQQHETMQYQHKSEISPSSVMEYLSAYRELLFLCHIFSELSINYDAFHKLYMEHWPIISKWYSQYVGPQDNPPSMQSIFCRKVFRSLNLI